MLLFCVHLTICYEFSGNIYVRGLLEFLAKFLVSVANTCVSSLSPVFLLDEAVSADSDDESLSSSSESSSSSSLSSSSSSEDEEEEEGERLSLDTMDESTMDSMALDSEKENERYCWYIGAH